MSVQFVKALLSDTSVLSSPATSFATKCKDLKRAYNQVRVMGGLGGRSGRDGYLMVMSDDYVNEAGVQGPDFEAAWALLVSLRATLHTCCVRMQPEVPGQCHIQTWSRAGQHCKTAVASIAIPCSMLQGLHIVEEHLVRLHFLPALYQ